MTKEVLERMLAEKQKTPGRLGVLAGQKEVLLRILSSVGCGSFESVNCAIIPQSLEEIGTKVVECLLACWPIANEASDLEIIRRLHHLRRHLTPGGCALLFLPSSRPLGPCEIERLKQLASSPRILIPKVVEGWLPFCVSDDAHEGLLLLKLEAVDTEPALPAEMVKARLMARCACILKEAFSNLQKLRSASDHDEYAKALSDVLSCQNGIYQELADALHLVVADKRTEHGSFAVSLGYRSPWVETVLGRQGEPVTVWPQVQKLPPHESVLKWLRVILGKGNSGIIPSVHDWLLQYNADRQRAIVPRSVTINRLVTRPSAQTPQIAPIASPEHVRILISENDRELWGARVARMISRLDDAYRNPLWEHPIQGESQADFRSVIINEGEPTSIGMCAYSLFLVSMLGVPRSFTAAPWLPPLFEKLASLDLSLAEAVREAWSACVESTTPPRFEAMCWIVPQFASVVGSVPLGSLLMFNSKPLLEGDVDKIGELVSSVFNLIRHTEDLIEHEEIVGKLKGVMEVYSDFSHEVAHFASTFFRQRLRPASSFFRINGNWVTNDARRAGYESPLAEIALHANESQLVEQWLVCDTPLIASCLKDLLFTWSSSQTWASSITFSTTTNFREIIRKCIFLAVRAGCVKQLLNQAGATSLINAMKQEAYLKKRCDEEAARCLANLDTSLERLFWKPPSGRLTLHQFQFVRLVIAALSNAIFHKPPKSQELFLVVRPSETLKDLEVSLRNERPPALPEVKGRGTRAVLESHINMLGGRAGPGNPIFGIDPTDSRYWLTRFSVPLKDVARTDD